MGEDERAASRGKRGSRGKKLSLFDRGEFVAVDGEGFSEGPEEIYTVGVNEEIYTGRQHYYALLSASDGSEIYEPNGRLSTKQCLDFLLDIKRNNKNAIVVVFGGSYDVTQMLVHDLTREQLLHLTKGSGLSKRIGARAFVDVSIGEHDYRLEYRPRKAFSIWRWSRGADKHIETINSKGDSVWKMSACDKVTVWDVWGFFQDSFAGVLKKWVPNDPDYQFIKRMKKERSIFVRLEIDDIRRYNAAELRCLVAVMDILRDAVRALDLTMTRWDGAGAIAAAMMAKNGVKDHKALSPPEVFRAARYAYSGGHIEVFKLGYHNGPVYHYDINSAYPHHFRRLPSLVGGRWIHGTDPRPPAGFTLVKVEYRFYENLPFYPLFFRERGGSIIYPSRGTGWYWFDEFDAARNFARKFGAVEFNVLEWHHFKPLDPNARPFAWIETAFEARKALIDEANRTGIPSGPEKIYKLGYNASYGKTAQQVGAREVEGELKEPTYFQLEWAGFVTAGCRAQLMNAAIEKPHAIISMATDGIFSIEPLTLDTPKEKILGAWEGKTHTGITMVMPGVYWLHDTPTEKNPDGLEHFSRGFDKEQMRKVEFVHKAWARKLDSLPISLTKLIGIGSALTSETLYKMRGQFVTSRRSLALNGDNSKRYPLPLHNTKPQKRLENTWPRDHHEDGLTPLHELHSAIYEIDWITDDALEEHDVSAARLA